MTKSQIVQELNSYKAAIKACDNHKDLNMWYDKLQVQLWKYTYRSVELKKHKNIEKAVDEIRIAIAQCRTYDATRTEVCDCIRKAIKLLEQLP